MNVDELQERAEALEEYLSLLAQITELEEELGLDCEYHAKKELAEVNEQLNWYAEQEQKEIARDVEWWIHHS